jgi:signal transduction histidine kinase
MGELAASIAHEINQPIAAILTNSSAALNWLKKDIPDLERGCHALARIQSDGKRAADVIRGLQALARKSGPNLENLDLDQTIREVLVLTHCELQRYGVMLEANLLCGDRTVRGDRVQVQQVLLNLIMNGIEAMSAGMACPKVLQITSKPVDSRAIQVTVEDSGDGINSADIDRIFDPFVTTKANGMGLGLSICRSIVEAHGGRLSVSPRLPRGSIFQFELPI